jgi:hypothetical protein
MIPPIPTDPENTIAADDFKNYLAAVDYPVLKLKKDVRDEVDERLQGLRDKNCNPLYPTDKSRKRVLKKFAGYRDSELGGPGRLGNTLPKTPKGAPPTPAQVAASPTKRRGFQVIDGVVIHTDRARGLENPDAHRYMHEIFDYILYTARDKLETINVALQNYCGLVKPGPRKAAMKQAYKRAVAQFYAYTKSFVSATHPSPYATTIAGIDFRPVRTNEGFFVSLRIHIHWKNPRHSSSTISVP